MLATPRKHNFKESDSYGLFPRHFGFRCGCGLAVCPRVFFGNQKMFGVLDLVFCFKPVSLIASGQASVFLPVQVGQIRDFAMRDCAGILRGHALNVNFGVNSRKENLEGITRSSPTGKGEERQQRCNGWRWRIDCCFSKWVLGRARAGSARQRQPRSP